MNNKRIKTPHQCIYMYSTPNKKNIFMVEVTINKKHHALYGIKTIEEAIKFRDDVRKNKHNANSIDRKYYNELIKIHKYVNICLGVGINQKSRKRDIVYGRFLFFTLAKKCTELSYEKIGKYLNKDHASVIHGINVFNNVVKLENRYNKILNIYLDEKWIDTRLTPNIIEEKILQKNTKLEIRVTELELKLKEKVPFLESYYKLDYKDRETVKERLDLIIRLMPSNQKRKEVFETINCSQ